MSDPDFLNRLYHIKPFKMVESPESKKHASQASAQDPQTDIIKPHKCFSEAVYKADEQKAQEGIIGTEMFSNLTSSIDHLFSKIEKIKSEFQTQLTNSHKKKASEKPSSAKKKLKYSDKQNQTCPPFELPPIPNHYKKVISEPEKIYQPDFKLQSPKGNILPTEQPKPLFVSFPNIPIESAEFPLTMRDFELGKCVGSGKFGDVHICRHRKTGFIFALKKVFKSTLMEYKMIDQFIKELKIHYLLNHPNIVKLYTHFEDEYHVFLLMEYAEGGMLMNFLQKQESFVSKTIDQIIGAVEYLHKNQIAHRDIKPENIVIFNDTNMKLCDFGWASMFDNEMKKTFCGTLDYVSPQMKDKGEYTVSVDLWSIGVLTFELLTGYAPYKNQIDKWKKKGSKLNEKWKWDIVFPPQMSSMAKDFISSLLKQNPNERASLRECRNHEFIWRYRGEVESQTETEFKLIL